MRFKKYFKVFLVPSSNANVIILESSLQPSDWLDGVTAETKNVAVFSELQSQSELCFIVMIGNICANEDDCDNDDGDNDDGDNDDDDNDLADNDDGDNDDGDDGHLAA